MPGSCAGPDSEISTTSLGDAPGVVGFVSPAESSCQIGGKSSLNLPNFAGLPLALFRRPIRLGTSPSLELRSQPIPSIPPLALFRRLLFRCRWACLSSLRTSCRLPFWQGWVCFVSQSGGRTNLPARATGPRNQLAHTNASIASRMHDWSLLGRSAVPGRIARRIRSTVLPKSLA